MSTAIQKTDTAIVTAEAWQCMRDQANVLIRSGFLPKTVDTPEKAIAIMMAGREFRIGAMQAIRSLYVVDGKVGMEAKLMKALVHRDLPQATLEIKEATDDHCIVMAGRPGKEPRAYTWTLKDAERAGLLKKEIWQRYPRDMNRNRAIAEACRAEFPDVIGGAVERGELDEVINTTGIASAIEYDDPTPLLEKIDAAKDVKGLNAVAREVSDLATKARISAADRDELTKRYQERRAELSSDAGVEAS